MCVTVHNMYVHVHVGLYVNACVCVSACKLACVSAGACLFSECLSASTSVCQSVCTHPVFSWPPIFTGLLSLVCFGWCLIKCWQNSVNGTHLELNSPS